MNILIIFILIFPFIFSSIIFPFKTRKMKDNLSHEETLKNLYLNKEIINITIGEPYQIIEATINLEKYDFFFLQNLDNVNYYNSKKSKNSFILDKRLSPFIDSPFKYGLYAQDSLSIKTLKETIKLNNISFVIGINSTLNDYANIGLNFYDSSEDLNINFYFQIQNKTKEKIKTMSIKYNNDSEGELIFGNYTFDYNPWKCNKNNLVSSNVDIIHQNNQGWKIYFDIIKFDNDQYNGNNHITFSLENGFIKGPLELNNLFLKNVFIQDKCNKIILESIMTFYYCDDDVSFINFPNLYFYNREMNYTFSLKKEELFIKKNGKIYFLIYFLEKNKFSNWILGKPFLKKYQLFFDYEKKKIGFYTPDKKKNDNLTSKLNIIIILIIVIFVLLFILYKFHYNQKRKRRINEVDDNYNYMTSLNTK